MGNWEDGVGEWKVCRSTQRNLFCPIMKHFMYVQEKHAAVLKSNPVRKEGMSERAKRESSSRSSDGADDPGSLPSFSFQTCSTSSPFPYIHVALCLPDTHFLLLLSPHFPFFFYSQPVFFIVGNPPRPTGP